MNKRRALAIGLTTALATTGLSAGAVLAHSNQWWPGPGGPPGGGGSPQTLNVRQSASRLAVTQIVNSWAQLIDSQDNAATAALFAPNGRIRLLYNNTSTQPFTLDPNGYSPSSTPTGGTPGGGCTAVGRQAITNYLAGTYGEANYQWPSAQHRTYVFNTLVQFQSDQQATSRSYVLTYSGNSQSGTLIDSGQMWNTYVYSPRAGWKITQMTMVDDSAQPDAPCAN